MSIFPLSVFEADADPRHRSALSDEEQYAALQPPKTIVVRFGVMYQVAEYSYDGDAKPGCGSKLVARTHRGTEVVEMLTTTCENAGCSKSVTRQELREYIEASGGKDYPFHSGGRVIRVATVEDLARQSALLQERPAMVRRCRELIAQLDLPMKLVEAEPILGGELITFYYMSEKRVDFRELVKSLAAEFKSRIEMRQVGARDEARLVADYERCGQHCCCKTFLKVLKPVSMKSAKVQKATLDPLKISGRCGRLMCCLRYEDVTYKQLKENLPPKGKRVGTAEGPGVVVDTKILVQLALVRLEGTEDREIAVPVEELMDPETCPPPGTKARAEEGDALRGMSPQRLETRLRREQRAPRERDKERKEPRAAGGEGEREVPREPTRQAEGEEGAPRRKRRRRRRSKDEQQDAFRARAEAGEGGVGETAAPRPDGARPDGGSTDAPGAPESGAGPGRRRKRRRRRGGRGPREGEGPAPPRPDDV